MYKAYHTRYVNGMPTGPFVFFNTSLNLKEYKILDPVLNLSFGKAGSFSFRVPIDNSQYENFEDIVSYVDLYRDDALIFSGRVFGQSKDFNNIYTINCEGILALFNDVIDNPREVILTQEKQSPVVENYLQTFVDIYDINADGYKQFRLGKVQIEEIVYDIYESFDSYDTVMSRLETLTDSYEGYLVARKESGVYYLDYYKDHVSISDQTIDFGVNLIDVSQETIPDNIITCLTVYGADIYDENNVYVKTLTTGLLESEEGIERFGRIYGVLNWSDITSETYLKKRAELYLKQIVKPRMSFEVTAVDLAKAGSDINYFSVGQRVHVKSAVHNIDDNFLIQQQQLNLLNPASNTMTLEAVKIGYIGKTKQSVSNIYNTIYNNSYSGGTTAYPISNEDIDNIINALA